VQVWIVHHAEAVGPAVDPQRPLSARGLAQAEWLAAELVAARFKPGAVWHSGKLRARQTAEAIWRAANPLAEFRMVRGLLPDDPPEIMCDAIRHDVRDLAIVGHMPHLPALLSLLLGRAADVPLHGFAALESRDDGVTWVEVRAGTSNF
jgi:phosphohistidine phosphatase